MYLSDSALCLRVHSVSKSCEWITFCGELE